MESPYELHEKDLARAGGVLADAFADDPVWKAFFAGEPWPDRLRLAHFETPIRYCRGYGYARAASPALEAVAGWLPGELADLGMWRLFRCGASRSLLRAARSLRVIGDYGRKMRRAFDPLAADMKAHMKGRPFLYLMIIGAAPAFQGRGFGGRLLGSVIEQSEREVLPIYLETATERNVRMYEGSGFRILDQVTLPVVDLPMWEMAREPGSAR